MHGDHYGKDHSETSQYFAYFKSLNDKEREKYIVKTKQKKIGYVDPYTLVLENFSVEALC